MKADKLYFNISVKHDSSKEKNGIGTATVATTKVETIEPLVNDANEYDLCISKFRVDSTTIPLVIPELKQPQKIADNKIDLNYWVALVGPNPLSAGSYVQMKKEYLYLRPKTFYPIYEDKHITEFFNGKEDGISIIDDTKAYTINKPLIKKAENDESMGYINNLDSFCYIYEAQEFVDSVNIALSLLFDDEQRTITDELGNPSKELAKADTRTTNAFFVLDGSRLTFYQRANTVYKIVFSNNLYKYFGMGFNVKWCIGFGGWMIANDATTRTAAIDNRDIYVSRYGNPSYRGISASLIEEVVTNENGEVVIGEDGQPKKVTRFLTFNESYDPDGTAFNIAINQFNVTETWTACKSILICSNTLPIRGEFIPTAPNDGLLIHENTLECRQLYGTIHTSTTTNVLPGDVGILTPTIKVLEAFFPVCAEGGDIRTTIIFSNDAMDVSTKHELVGDVSQLRQFDISIKWLDVYNNLHDLELLEGSCCDIRIAFVKKTVKQDFLYRALSEVVGCLGGKDPAVPPSKRTRNGFIKI